MRRTSAFAAALLALFVASKAAAETWIPVGLDRGQQVAVRLDGVPDNKSVPFTAVLASFPRAWPANNHRYTVWIAEFDCSARTRVVKSVAQYSSRRDPVRTVVNEQPIGDDNSAVAAQLGIVCDESSAARRGRQFNHLGEFGDYLTH